MRPTIGIPMDWKEKGTFKLPYYAIRDSYFNAIWDAGGLPVGIPLLETSGNDYVMHVDGVMLPGGDYPSPSRWYGDGHGIPDEHPRSIVNEQMVRDLLLLDKPFLAVCAGMQEMAVATGGLLHWRVAEAVPSEIQHRMGSASEIAHTVQAAPDTLFAKLAGTAAYSVNSQHFEAVKQVGAGVIISGRAPDGVIEAIEIPGKRFALGVQWHPEMGFTEHDHNLIVGLVKASKMA